jgi:hypothetical protein
MKPLMTFWVEKDAIVCLISAAVTSPLKMMAMPSCELRDLAVTKRTKAALLFPEMEPCPFAFQVVYHLDVKPFFKVRFPLRILGIGFTPNFDLPFDRNTARLYQTDWLLCCLTSKDFSCEHPLLPPRGLEVFLPDPGGRFMWVPSFRPLPEGLKDRLIHFMKGF